jgi:hypothetical protein
MRMRSGLLICALSCFITATAFAGAVRPGFSTYTLPRSDDGHTWAINIGFVVNFYGLTFGRVHVNNNGNITFGLPLSTYTPHELTSTQRQIIAPFFADVDTRAAGNPVTYGAGTVAGRMAFGVNWVDVDCYYSSDTRWVLNSFQLVLIDRSDTGQGNFDFEFNYDRIRWESGQASGGDGSCLGGYPARAGFSSGTGEPGTFYELPGSGVVGAFLDGGPADTALIHNSWNSEVLGRYLFAARSGTISLCEDDIDGDGVCDDLDACAGTVIPEQTVPARELRVNHWALIDDDGVFDTVAPPNNSPEPPTFTIHDTAGCSCEQILAALGLGAGHDYYGCGLEVMEEWVALMTAPPESPVSGSRLGPAAYPDQGCSAGRAGSIGGTGHGRAGFLALAVLGLLWYRRRATQSR